jgi:hypothetical protein
VQGTDLTSVGIVFELMANRHHDDRLTVLHLEQRHVAGPAERAGMSDLAGPLFGVYTQRSAAGRQVAVA